MQSLATFNKPQARFLELETKFRAFVGGYGSGKTWVGCGSQIIHMIEHPRVPLGYFAPTYPQIRDIYFPTIDEVAYSFGMRADVKESNKEVHIYRGSKYYGTSIARSMDDPGSIVGFKIGRALVDEIDIMPLKKATMAWRKIIARLRYVKNLTPEQEQRNAELGILQVANGVDIATTPEGFNFVYQQFVTHLREKPENAKFYSLVHASTYENEKNLPDDYISSIRATYPPNLVEAYLLGRFVPLRTGLVYHCYNREKSRSFENVIRNEDRSSKETLYVGMDFNVGKMAGIVHVRRGDAFHAVEEIINAYDTPDIVRILKERFWRYKDGKYERTCDIRIYPDASGGSRSSKNAQETDLKILTDAGFSVHAHSQNPPVKDRINSVNALFCNSEGLRRYYVNDKNCPRFADCLEQQAWGENGEPDKSNDLDHPVDAAGYFIHYENPLVKPVFSINMGTAR